MVPERPACMGTYKLMFFLWLGVSSIGIRRQINGSVMGSQAIALCSCALAIDQEDQNPKQVIAHMEALVASMFSPRRQLPANHQPALLCKIASSSSS